MRQKIIRISIIVVLLYPILSYPLAIFLGINHRVIILIYLIASAPAGSYFLCYDDYFRFKKKYSTFEESLEENFIIYTICIYAVLIMFFVLLVLKIKH